MSHRISVEEVALLQRLREQGSWLYAPHPGARAPRGGAFDPVILPGRILDCIVAEREAGLEEGKRVAAREAYRELDTLRQEGTLDVGTKPAKPKNGQKGQALAEFGIVVTLLTVLTLGAVEFGYAFFALHLVTQATAAGARAASVLQVGRRSACGTIGAAAKAAITDLVIAQASSVASGITVQVDQYDSCPGSSPCGPSCTPIVDGGAGACSTPPPTLPVVCVTVNGTIPSIFGLRKTSAFVRAEGFRDEGRY